MTQIQWFPGHMTRAKREMMLMLERVDMIIEIRDARCPLSSKNPLIDEIISNKPRLIVLNKRDMADDQITKHWIKHLEAHGHVIALDALNDDVRVKVVEACLKVMQPKFDRWKARGIQARKIRAMVAGIPNVGKSTLINQLAKKKVMTTANRPGVTMALKWANVHPKLDILDTPGILWPKFEDPEVGRRLALTGAIKESLLGLQDLAYVGFEWVNQHYPRAIAHRYSLSTKQADEFFRALKDVRKVQNITQAYDIFLRELRQGTLGPMSFEDVKDLA